MITNFVFAEYKKTKLCCIRITEGKYDVIDTFSLEPISNRPNICLIFKECQKPIYFVMA